MDQSTQERLMEAYPFSLFQTKETKEIEVPDSNQDVLLEPVYPESYNFKLHLLVNSPISLSSTKGRPGRFITPMAATSMYLLRLEFGIYHCGP